MIRVDAGGDFAQICDPMCLKKNVFHLAFEIFGCVEIGSHDNYSCRLEAFIPLELLQDFHARNVGEVNIQQDEDGQSRLQASLSFLH